MPPTRTLPPAKAVKTERTHEENQERAYIAASRRSDRSLEARVESARRASEIHKRRTGRSLRVTEQDVINEEMYEEEDDDLPMQYRRLTAHLQTGNADFNRRLSAYLTNHVAMRSALEQSISNSYAQQYPNAPQFAGQHSMFPSPMLAHQQGQQQMMQPPQSPSMYRQAPYPSPRTQQQAFQPASHHRSASIATPQELTTTSHSPIASNDSRRLSMPTVPTASASPTQARTPVSASSTTPQQRPSFPQGSFSQQYNPMAYDMSAFNNNFSPFTTALPAESQGLLGSTMNMNDPLSQMMMQGSSTLPGNFYDFSNQPLPQTTSIGKQQSYPSVSGLNSTLAPASSHELSQRPQDYNNSQDFFNDALNADSNGVTPSGTPGANDWSSYINTDAWDLPSSQTSQ
ncbi:hypothetical protein N431DRAFT_469396 [Stipitochalara longipes BDJ]|nr:hypothetical protein N431DRAFT_469396 [Stipitochalara longipes BDJ]